jgi:hypothetical protein
MSDYDHRGTWAKTGIGYACTPNYGGHAAGPEPDHSHRLDAGRPEISHEDLELARQGMPSQSVSHAEILAAQELMAELDREGHISYGTREPGGRLIEAHDNSPEARAMHDAQEELAHREAMAEAKFMASFNEPEAGA